MKDKLKSRVATGVVVVATIALAGIAVFTAMRLYKLRGEPVAPTAPRESFAWDCSKYNFNVSGSGVVSVQNDSSRNEPDQKARVVINGNQIAEFDVPALSPNQGVTLGNIAVPNEPFSWEVIGTKDCQDSGQASPVVSCQELAFTISEPSATPTGSTTPTSTLTPTATATLTPTPTPTATPTATATPTSTSTPTPTDEPRGGSDPTPTPTTQPTSTPTPTDVPQTSTPTPTATSIADSGTQAGTGDQTAQLPAAGVSFPTIIAISLGMLLILFAFILAI